MSQSSTGAPLDNQQTDRLHSAIADLSPMQLQWISGYAAGLAASGHQSPPAAAVEPARHLTILYGSQTGNGEQVAAALKLRADEQGYTAKLVSLADFKPANLKRESLVSFVISTHGEGDPPDDAELFHEYLLSDKAAELAGLSYAVLALGDSSYVNFCQTGREFDARLAELGAERFAPLAECDLDYDELAADWSKQVVAKLPELLGSGSAVPHLRAVQNVATYGKHNPFVARVLCNDRITGRNSSKDVRHIELSLEGSNLSYAPGDALAVISDNPPALVDEVLELLSLDPDASITLRDETVTLKDALSGKLEITAVNLGFLRAWADISGSTELAAILDSGRQDSLAELVDGHQIIDIMRRYPATPDAATLIASLRKLSPRSYSIASGPSANPDEVHLTVAALRYDAFGRPHWGAASTYLADRISDGTSVSVFVEPNTRFRLPEPHRPIIMIGPGTGVAPFRAFLEERIEQGATGKNWLIFGDRNFDSDFLYQLEWQRYLKQGHLHHLHVAFSRDQERKVYVQHRILEHAAAIHDWLEDGAVIYVCGDAKRMANDVNDALITVLQQHEGLDRDDAEQRLKKLRSEGRYQRDVY